MIARIAACVCSLAASAAAGDVARTPPMGFNTWNLYKCSVTATILEQTATAMVKTGLKDSGYIYVNSDDCWMSFNRSADGNQVPDPGKFPNGFKAVADFIHAQGMKSGLYTAKGPHTCQKRAASCLHEAQDAKLWASWGIDYVKDDSCSTCSMPNGTRYSDMDDYHRMWQGIQDSGRPMILTVEGSPPADVITHGGWGNAKRVGHDISPSWGSMISLVDIGAGLWPYAHTTINKEFGGWWNDLDMIEIGNGGGLSSPAASSAAGTWPWAVAKKTAGAGWTMGADGSFKNGGMCLTAGNPVQMMACSAGKTSTQQFSLVTSGPKKGNLFLKSKPSSCLALEGGGHEDGPLTMALCKQGKVGMNEEFTLADGQLCSHSLSNEEELCLKPMNTMPHSGGGGHAHHSGGDGGFDCIADAAALARCQVHFTSECMHNIRHRYPAAAVATRHSPSYTRVPATAYRVPPLPLRDETTTNHHHSVDDHEGTSPPRERHPKDGHSSFGRGQEPRRARNLAGCSRCASAASVGQTWCRAFPSRRHHGLVVVFGSCGDSLRSLSPDANLDQV